MFSICFSPDGMYLATGSIDSNVTVWEWRAHRLAMKLTDSTGGVNCVTFSPDGNTIITGNEDGEVQGWDVKTKEHIFILKSDENSIKGHSQAVFGCAFSPDGKTIVSGSGDSTVRIWDMCTNEDPMTLRYATLKDVRVVTFSNDGKYVFSGSNDRTIRKWDWTSGGVLQEYEGHGKYVGALAMDPKKNRIVSGSFDQTIR